MEQKTKIYTICASETYKVMKNKAMFKLENELPNFEDIYDLTC